MNFVLVGSTRLLHHPPPPHLKRRRRHPRERLARRRGAARSEVDRGHGLVEEGPPGARRRHELEAQLGLLRCEVHVVDVQSWRGAVPHTATVHHVSVTDAARLADIFFSKR